MNDEDGVEITQSGMDDHTLIQPTFMMRDVEFQITRFNASEGWEVLEYMRYQLATSKSEKGMLARIVPPDLLTGFTQGVLESQNMGEEEEGTANVEAVQAIMNLVDLVLSLEPSIIKRLKKSLFSKIRYRKSSAHNYAWLIGKEDDALAGMPYSAFYLLIVRSILVNFFDSFSGILSLIPGSES